MIFGRLRQSHTAIASAFGQLVYALLNTWPSYTSELYRSNTTKLLSSPMTTGEEALLGSLPSLGAMIGSAVIGVLINKIGRRNGGVVSSLPVLIAWAIISVSSSMKYILAARFLAGISGGAGLVLAPIFTSEVAEDSIRGTLASAKLSIAKYRGVPVSSIIVMDEFTRLKQQLTPSVELISITDIDIKAEESEKEKLNLEDLEPVKLQPQSTMKLLCSEPASKRAFTVVAVVLSLQVFMGIVPVQVYAKRVFIESDPIRADMYTILFAVVLLLGAAVTGIITDKAGRRVLIIVSSVLVFVSMTTLGFLLQTKVAPPLITVLMIFMYSFTFMCGAGTIPYVLLAEVFISEVQNLASMIAIELVWFNNFVIIGIFPYMNNAFGIYGSFYIFGIVGLCNAIFSYFFVPETKGLSNAQIQDAFTSRKKN